MLATSTSGGSTTGWRFLPGTDTSDSTRSAIIFGMTLAWPGRTEEDSAGTIIRGALVGSTSVGLILQRGQPQGLPCFSFIVTLFDDSKPGPSSSKRLSFSCGRVEALCKL